jgi:hypothetical protein
MLVEVIVLLAVNLNVGIDEIIQRRAILFGE